ncbi:MAG: DUF3793 family protein [Clostridiales bacterium]|nr:DUF3793 family protein [Clostridiales bacterium]
MENQEYKKFYNRLKILDGKDLIENYLVYNLSTVISKVKPSVTITIHKNHYTLFEAWKKHGAKFVEELGLEYLDLRDCKRILIVLVYDKQIIEECISYKDNKEFLISIGYPKENDPYINLYLLKKRYSIYNCPHEIGIFLGIPIEDVKDFIECGEKKCILCKYWKVYNNYHEAKKIFNRYDKVKKHTVKHLLLGNKTLEVADGLRNFF